MKYPVATELEGSKESNTSNCNADFCAILKLCNIKFKKGFFSSKHLPAYLSLKTKRIDYPV